MSKVLVISSDCHAGAMPDGYKPYIPEQYHAAVDAWWLGYAREMMQRMGTFFDQEAVEQFAEQAGHDGTAKFTGDAAAAAAAASDDQLWAFLHDENSIVAPRHGEWDPDIRLRELEEDGIAGEIVFPQMAPFGAGLLQYRHDVPPEHAPPPPSELRHCDALPRRRGGRVGRRR